MKIYVVVSGEYSDKGISAVFVDKEKAMSYCFAQNEMGYDGGFWDNHRIEEYDTKDEDMDGSIEHGYVYRCRYNDSTQSEEIKVWICSKQSFNHHHYEICQGYSDLERNGVYEIHCWLKTEDQDLALKICRDKLAAYKAQRWGI